MNTIFSHLFRHLVRRHILIWIVTLVLILIFLTALGTLSWGVRMKITCRVAVTPEPEKSLFRITIPDRSFLSIREGDTATFSDDKIGPHEGIIRSVKKEGNRVELIIAFTGLPGKAAEGTVTLRGERLLGAFFKN